MGRGCGEGETCGPGDLAREGGGDGKGEAVSS